MLAAAGALRAAQEASRVTPRYPGPRVHHHRLPPRPRPGLRPGRRPRQAYPRRGRSWSLRRGAGPSDQPQRSGGLDARGMAPVPGRRPVCLAAPGRRGERGLCAAALRPAHHRGAAGASLAGGLGGWISPRGADSGGQAARGWAGAEADAGRPRDPQLPEVRRHGPAGRAGGRGGDSRSSLEPARTLRCGVRPRDTGVGFSVYHTGDGQRCATLRQRGRAGRPRGIELGPTAAGEAPRRPIPPRHVVVESQSAEA
mmetsp:Transcript_16976/g.43273  ORF Transcript_16976/g.43273 Transcript_16976/m.43273 type:complete len:255 (+) Transcript_16976:976-1740(+)